MSVAGLCVVYITGLVWSGEVAFLIADVSELTIGSIFIDLPMKMEPIVSSETSAIRTQTPGNYPKRNKLHLEHGESLKTRHSLLVSEDVGMKVSRITVTFVPADKERHLNIGELLQWQQTFETRPSFKLYKRTRCKS